MLMRHRASSRKSRAIQEAFQSGGFKAAMAALTDEYMDKLPVVPGTSIKEIKERLHAVQGSRRDATGHALRAGRPSRWSRMRGVSRSVGSKR